MAAGNVEALWARTLFSPVPARNAFEVTVERLAQSIRLGVVVDGEQLPPERELAETFGVSRVTLREAIKALRDVGLVESRRGRGGGTFIVSPKVQRPRPPDQISRSLGHSLDDALALRRVVEPGAAALAATRTLTAADRASLHRYLDEATNCEAGSRRLADSRLHLAIAALGGSASVTAVVADVQMRLDELLRAIPVIAANIAHSNVQHAAIVDAILAARADRARTEMEEHIDGTAALLRGFLS
ncbi:MAG TPA: GntR family transcriptional regulator [Jatrophihabitantaceae bacterium]|jgi:DNA-binding FadR family transcriptional regulator